eukprot:symbB.v1.2.008602.t1/scaffold523.1/size192511/24
MQLQQSANGQDVTAKDVGHFASTKEEIKLPKRTDAIFDEFGTVLAKSSAAESFKSSRVCQSVGSFLKDRCDPGSSLVISLSGGVDSMVLSHCLILLRKQLQLELSAVHIDYNIRPSSQVEAAFVNTWARQVALPLTLVQLNGTESLSRMAFEDYSRGARYEAYHLAMEAMEDRAVAVITGHHEDDAAENVLSNLFMGRSLFHIPVMGPEAFIEGVRIWRPLFSLSKRDIYAFAREMDIPYLKNIDAPCGK